MDFVVQFVGIILFVTLSSADGEVMAYNVFMPDDAKVCDIDMPVKHPHDTFIRVKKTMVSEKDWATAAIECLDTDYELYKVQDAFLEISNTVNAGPVTGSLTALHLEQTFYKKKKLQKGLQKLSNAQIFIATGAVSGVDLDNEMIATNWALKSAADKKITITAKPRTGGKASTLELDLTKGTEVKIANTTEEMAKGDLGEEMGMDDPHFYIYARLVNPAPTKKADCKKPKSTTSRSKHAMPSGVGVTGETGASIACSNTQWP